MLRNYLLCKAGHASYYKRTRHYAASDSFPGSISKNEHEHRMDVVEPCLTDRVCGCVCVAGEVLQASFGEGTARVRHIIVSK